MSWSVLQDYDALILLNAVPHKRIWCNSLLLRNSGPAIRTCGRLPYATKHSLLSVGLSSVLRGISRPQIEKASPRGPKLRLKVVTRDASFVEEQSRAASNIRHDLHAWMQRFDLEFGIEEDNRALLSLFNWASRTIFRDVTLQRTPAVFQPSVVSQLIA